jgi:hypothetical protein
MAEGKTMTTATSKKATSRKSPAKKAPAKKKARAKKGKVAPVIPLLTKPTSKSSGTPKVEVFGHAELAESVRDRQVEIDSLTAEQKIDKADLIEVCKKARIEAESDGLFAKTCAVAVSDNGKPVNVVFGNKYSTVSLDHEESLQTALGESYDTLFERRAAVKLRGDVTLADLRKTLGDKFDAFASLFEVTEFIGAKKSLLESRFALRKDLDDEANHVVDAVVEQVRYTPSVKTK